jgi:hypothetical protein
MRRVLKHGGRLALSVWNSTGLYNDAVGGALACFVSNEAAVRFCASRQAPTKEELQRLATEAGFSAVEVRVDRINVHLPRVDKFALDHLAATPVASVIAAAGPGRASKLCERHGSAAPLCRWRWSDYRDVVSEARGNIVRVEATQNVKIRCETRRAIVQRGA